MKNQFICTFTNKTFYIETTRKRAQWWKEEQERHLWLPLVGLEDGIDTHTGSSHPCTSDSSATYPGPAWIHTRGGGCTVTRSSVRCRPTLEPNGMGETRDPCHAVGHSTEIWVSIHMKESKMFNSQLPSFKFFHGMQNIPGDLSPLGDIFPITNVSSALVDSRKDCVL